MRFVFDLGGLRMRPDCGYRERAGQQPALLQKIPPGDHDVFVAANIINQRRGSLSRPRSYLVLAGVEAGIFSSAIIVAVGTPGGPSGPSNFNNRCDGSVSK